MSKQSQIFNQFLGEVSDLTDALHKACEKYSAVWEDQMPSEDPIEPIRLTDFQKKNPPKDSE